jgi:hypothetical protein
MGNSGLKRQVSPAFRAQDNGFPKFADATNYWVVRPASGGIVVGNIVEITIDAEAILEE